MTESDDAVIRRLVQAWVVLRDCGDWDRFAALWHPDGRMVATWFDGRASDFIAKSRAAFGGETIAHHVLGGTSVEVVRERAVATSRMVLHLRTRVDGILCDIACMGRFVDFFIRSDSEWQLVLKQPVYEKDRIDPVVPDETINLDRSLLESFPAGYRHLAYAQSRIGMTVDRKLPGATGPAADRLAAATRGWLMGEDLPQHRNEQDERIGEVS